MQAIIIIIIIITFYFDRVTYIIIEDDNIFMIKLDKLTIPPCYS